MSTKALEKAIEISGSQSGLARKIGVKQANIWWWLNKSKVIPSQYVLPISKATGVPAEELLAPDIFGQDAAA